MQVVITSFDEEIYEATMPLSEFGSFAGEIMLDSEATLGSYQIRVIHRGEAIGYGFFEVGRIPQTDVSSQCKRPLNQISPLATQSKPSLMPAFSLVAPSWATRCTGQPAPKILSLMAAQATAVFSFRNTERDLGYYFYNNDYAPTEFIA